MEDSLRYLIVCLVALFASGLTFFSGFGLGTLLLPAFALFFPVQIAVALTAGVHFLNGAFKLLLVGKHADLRVALRFGLPAIAAAFLGAKLLLLLSGFEPIARWGERPFVITPVKLAIAILMIGFAAIEVLPKLQKMALPPRYLPLGGLLSGFFGGLSGHQGALRSGFLVRAGLSKEAFVATGALIGLVIDLSRISVYAERLVSAELAPHRALFAAAALSAFAGAWIGNRLLKKVTLRAIEIAVAVMLVLIALALGAGLI